jgi:hypothetical protein
MIAPSGRRGPLARRMAPALLAALLLLPGCTAPEEQVAGRSPATAALGATPTLAGSAASGTPPRAAATESRPVAPGGSSGPATLAQVGFLPLPGFTADVWAHNGFAYVGSTGFRVPNRCPATGVRVVDLADPAHPALVGAVAAIPRTSQEKVVVRRIDTAAFHGDLLATGVQSCDMPTGDAPRGIDLWDVTDPRRPQHLAFWDSGPQSYKGVHELWLFARGDRAYVAASVPRSEVEEGGQGDFRLVEVTDPRRPAQVSSWGAVRDGGLPLPPGDVLDFDHSAYVNAAGTLAILSYTDFGVLFLDIADPAHPALVGRATYPPPLHTHSVWLAANETVLLVCDEILDPSPGRWGYLRLWDVHNPAAPTEIGHFATPDALSTRRDGDYSAHNPVVVGTTAFLSWYSDGIRVVDIADPAAPRELAAFVPPPAADPYGVFKTAPEVWGVAVTGDLVLASDINAGLYVLRYARRGSEGLKV